MQGRRVTKETHKSRSRTGVVAGAAAVLVVVAVVVSAVV